MRNRTIHSDRKFRMVLLLTLLLTLVMMAVSINAGQIRIPLGTVIDTLFGGGTPEDELTLFQFRLPRIVLAVLVGMGIAVSGAMLQGISQNPLADPGILGINSGAGFAVVLYMFFFQATTFLNKWASVFLMPAIALLGAFLAAFLIYAISLKKGKITPVRLLLVGIGINSAFGAGLIVFQMKMEPVDFMKAIVWLSGTIWGTNWTFVGAVLPWLCVLIPLAWYKSRMLDLLQFNDPISTGVGLHVERERRLMLLISVALAGVCVSVGGGITFLGLIAPHIARKLVGARHARVLPATAAIGGLLLLTADTLGRVVMSPMEIPVGLVVSILGGIYFVYLLIRTT
ncbi:iron complex transport system permease protein [Paenibacillus phyllosphaerae]|uniref:Iron complex transport system permease protein n=1 Tax=Paenibacillus phyllosphaerae TaxID=274593 RepID=A0A7W5FPL9_9BACL|nr:iron ABC transporter permease [Paenibacillus phyllosphaerae]MBB3112496.1 iron complex transport system permease protein [Paenibacillus phyllosphaerae]